MTLKFGEQDWENDPAEVGDFIAWVYKNNWYIWENHIERPK